MARLLLAWHSRTGRTARLKDLVLQGVQREPGLEVRVRSAAEASVDDFLWADGYLFGTPENFGSMAGLFKDFLERVYLQVQGPQYGPVDPAAEPDRTALQARIAGRPYALFVAAGNDGSGAVREVQRILRGLALKPVAESLVWRGNDPGFELDAVPDWGQGFAAGLQLGLW